MDRVVESLEAFPNQQYGLAGESHQVLKSLLSRGFDDSAQSTGQGLEPTDVSDESGFLIPYTQVRRELTLRRGVRCSNEHWIGRCGGSEGVIDSVNDDTSQSLLQGLAQSWL